MMWVFTKLSVPLGAKKDFSWEEQKLSRPLEVLAFLLVAESGVEKVKDMCVAS